MAAFQVVFMVLVAGIALIAIIMLVVSGGFNPPPCHDDNSTFNQYDVHVNLTDKVDLRSRSFDKCPQNVTCESCDGAANKLKLQLQELTSKSALLQEEIQKREQDASSSLAASLSELASCVNSTRVLEAGLVELQGRLQKQGVVLELCTNTSVQLHAAAASLDAQLEEADGELATCKHNAEELRLEHVKHAQVLQELNATNTNCSSRVATLLKQVESERNLTSQIKANCTARNTTRTLSASVLKFIERCQDKVRGVALTRIPSGQYLFSTSEVNWFTAVKRCHAKGLELVSVESALENEALVREARRITQNEGNRRFWLSGADLGSEGVFSWMSTGGELSYTAWLSHEPNNAAGGEHCMQLWNRRGYFGWNDAACTMLAGYICEVPAVCRT